MVPTKEEMKKVFAYPTISYDAKEMYTCPNCKEETTVWEWDKKTSEVFEGYIISLTSAYNEDWREFCCPKCNTLAYDREIDEASGNDVEDPWSDNQNVSMCFEVFVGEHNFAFEIADDHWYSEAKERWAKKYYATLPILDAVVKVEDEIFSNEEKSYDFYLEAKAAGKVLSEEHY